MADLINLNTARKARTKADARQAAAENRARHGRTKAEKSLEAARSDKAARLLDDAKREP